MNVFGGAKTPIPRIKNTMRKLVIRLLRAMNYGRMEGGKDVGQRKDVIDPLLFCVIVPKRFLENRWCRSTNMKFILGVPRKTINTLL